MTAKSYHAGAQCRFCKQSATQSKMVKYGVRHHAHPVCLYQHRGIAAINDLHNWQLLHLPIVAMMEAGVTLEQVRVWQDRIACVDGNNNKGESMIIKYGEGRTKEGPGVSIELTGDEVALAIDTWLVAHDVHVHGGRTSTRQGS